MKRVIEGGKDDFLTLLQERRGEAETTAKRRELPQTTRSRHRGITQGLDFAMHAIRDWVVPEPPKTWLYGLTADEWFRLACIGTESEVAPCCGNISEIREVLQALATCQAGYDSWLQGSMGGSLLTLIGEEEDGEHGLLNEKAFPLLARVLTGVRAQLAEQRAEGQAAVARSLQAHPPATS